MQITLLLLTIISVYFGWFWQDDVNKDGYNLINFVWIYCIGYYLAQHFDCSKISCLIFLLVCIICSLSNALMFIVMNSYPAWTYNNPLLVVAAISFFLFFLSFNISSKCVNLIASSTLGVYLIHENSYMSRIVYGERFSSFYSDNIINFIISVLFCFIGCAAIDLCIRKMLCKPLLNVLSYVWRKTRY